MGKQHGILLTASVLLALAAVDGCSAADAGEGARPEQTPTRATSAVDVSESDSLVETLRSFEAFATELERRFTAGALDARWRGVWSSFVEARQQPGVRELVQALKTSSFAAADSDASRLQQYIESFRPIFAEVQAREAAGTIDSDLADLHAQLLTLLSDGALSEPARADASVEKARSFCCRIFHPRTVSILDPFCINFRTIGLLAGAKCVGFAVAAIADGSELTGGNCAEFPECNIAAPALGG